MARILVVDDQALVGKVVTETLEADGHEVHFAPSGTHAMHALLNLHFDAVVMDLRMPGFSGLRLTRLIRRNLDLAPAVVLFSGARRGELDAAARLLGIEEVVPKGARASALRSAVRRALVAEPSDVAEPAPVLAPSARPAPPPLEPRA